jgi:hypothetical protein
MQTDREYRKMIDTIWEDSTFCDYWKRIPRGVDFESLEPYFVDFILEHYENNEFFIRLMDELNPDGSKPYPEHDKYQGDKYEGIILASLNMLWGIQ